jgi:tetratricopeptide (TPR) repeat protein
MTAVPSLKELTDAALVLHKAGCIAEAEGAYRKVLEANPDHLNALHLLGVLLVDNGRAEAGLPLLERAAALVTAGGENPQHSPLYNNLGNALNALGRRDEAVARYERSLGLRPGDPEVHANLGGTLVAQGKIAEAIPHYETATSESRRADWHHKLAKLYAVSGRLADAEACYRAALDCDPDYGLALYDFGYFLWKHHRSAEAVAVLEHLRKVDPNHVEVHCTLGNALRDAGKHSEAIPCFAKYCELLPESAEARLHLGLTLSEFGKHEAAMSFIEWAVILDPKSAVAQIELGNALLRVDKTAEAREAFLRASALQQYITRKAILPKPRFSALCVITPGTANIPYDYLIGRGAYDAHMLWYLPGGEYDLAALRANTDVVVNLLSDADNGRAILPHVGAFVESLGKPVINHPDLIARTDRAAMARLAATIPGCRTARIMGIDANSLIGGYWPDVFTPPFLVRVAGRHNGDDFEKIETREDLRTFAARHPGAEFYLMDYIDVRSPDGYYRKYRFFGIDGEILPYHLAIASHWKVHHWRTDMATTPWMKEEEAAFLETPGAVFGERQTAALRALMQATGLNYVGVDCALDESGNVVVFEANAAMLVHGNNTTFPYKDKPVRRIKDSFDAMLERHAARTAP